MFGRHSVFGHIGERGFDVSGALVLVDPPVWVSGHFGEFFQGRMGRDGPIVLVTVPCAALGVEVLAEPGFFEVDGADEAVARRFFEALGGVPNLRFRVTLEAPLGAGAGMSTAALLALAKAAGLDATPASLLAAEGAVDPLILGAPGDVLWASREAQSVRTFGPAPEFAVVGGFFGPPEQTDAADANFADVSDIADFWGEAEARGDRAALAGIATEAARRTTALRGPYSDPTEQLARDLGALGMVRAHTGSARGLLFAPGRVPGSVAEALTEAGFAHVISFQTGSAT